jgi:phosphoglycolate phosphatase
VKKRPYFECVLLDLDGTLVDSNRLVVSSVRHAAKQSGKRVPGGPEILQRHLEYGSPKKLLRSFKVRDEEDYWNYYVEHPSKLRMFDSQLRSKLRKISRAGVTLGIVTSLPRKAVTPAIEHFGLAEYFSVVKTAQWRTSKSRQINSALRDLGLSIRGDDVLPVMYLGDRVGDAKAAKKAAKGGRIWSGVALWNGQKIMEFFDAEPDFVFRDFDEFVDVITTPMLPEQDYLSPSPDCFSPHPRYLKAKDRIPRSSCSSCFFPSDCLNCRRLDYFTRRKMPERELRSLSKVIGAPTQSAEQFYPLQVHTKDSDMKDVRRMVRAFKSGDNYHKFRLGLSMARRLSRLARATPKYRGIDLIVPVPTTKKKLQKRGYNPPAELAKVVGAAHGIPVSTNCLSTTAKKSRKQTRHSKTWDEDLTRIAGNVRVRNRKLMAGKKVLLIDDILTRGVTLAAYTMAIRDQVKPRPRVVALTFGLSKVARNLPRG